MKAHPSLYLTGVFFEKLKTMIDQLSDDQYETVKSFTFYINQQNADVFLPYLKLIDKTESYYTYPIKKNLSAVFFKNNDNYYLIDLNHHK